MKKVLIVILLFFLTSCTQVIDSLQGLVNPDNNSNNPTPVPPISETDPLNDFPKISDLSSITPNNGKKHHFNDNLKTNGPMTEECFPSIGSPKLLVVPITFTDSKSSKTDLSIISSDLNKCFNGTQVETGYYSLNEYYKISSYNKLNVTADILDFYTAEHESNYYSSLEKNTHGHQEGSSALLEEVVSYYDKTINFDDYDYDKDGFIDGIWLIYDHKIDFGGNFWWAYQTQAHIPGQYDGKRTAYYAFASAYFMYPDKNGKTAYNKNNIKIDAHTYIHETGHMMGLDDYYSYNDDYLTMDYSTSSNYGTYGYDMMDQTHGDHGVLSKLLLGWIDPYIITKTAYVSLKSFIKTGEAILIPNSTIDFKNKMTIYDHYYLIVCYDASLINEKDKPIKINGLGNVDGIIVYECHAEKPLTPGYIGKTYKTGFLYNNSDDKVFSIRDGFDYERSEWFVRFLTNGKESKKNNKVLFQLNDCLRNSKTEKTSVPFNFKVVRRDRTSDGVLDKYVLSIKVY